MSKRSISKARESWLQNGSFFSLSELLNRGFR